MRNKIICSKCNRYIGDCNDEPIGIVKCMDCYTEEKTKEKTNKANLKLVVDNTK